MAVRNKPTLIPIRAFMVAHPPIQPSLYPGGSEHLQHAFPPPVTLTTLLPTERKISAAFILQIGFSDSILLIQLIMLILRIPTKSLSLKLIGTPKL